jgi:hypothetical protein
MMGRHVGAVVIAVLMGLCHTPPVSAQASVVRDLAAGQFRAHLPLGGEFDEDKGIGDFAVRGDHLYVAAADPQGEWRIFIYDITDRSNPRFVATEPIASQPGANFRLNTVAVRGDWLYTAGNNDNLFVIDIEHPTLPVVFVRSDALVNDLEDTFDIDFFGFQFSEVQDIKYRKLIIEDGNMYVLFDFTVDTDALFVPELTNSSVAVVNHVDDFPLRVCGREDCRQTGTQTRDVLLNNLADTGDDIKSFDYEDGRLFLGFDELLDVIPVGESTNVELDEGGCGGVFDCLKDLFIGGEDDPYRDLVVDGDTVYIVFTDGLLVKKVSGIRGEGRVEQTEILEIEPSLNFRDSDGFGTVFVDDDKAYLADLNGNVLVLNDADGATPGVEGALVNAASASDGKVTGMDEDFGDFFVATSDNGLFIITAFGFDGGSSGGCVSRPSGQVNGLTLALLLLPLVGIAGWRGRRRTGF